MTDTREALGEAAVAIWGEQARDVVIHDQVMFERMCRFDTFLDAEAWIDAAMMLVSDWAWIAVRYMITKAMHEIGEAGLDPIKALPEYITNAAFEACLKAKEQADGTS